MFTRLAEFRLFRSWGVAPRLQGALSAQEALPANGSLPPRRIRPQALVCHWSLIDGGTQLGCRWSLEAPTPTAPENRKRTNHQIFPVARGTRSRRRRAPNPAWCDGPSSLAPDFT